MDDFSAYKQECTCGHHISTHFQDETRIYNSESREYVIHKFRGSCLGMRCDCKLYCDKAEKP